MLTNRKWRAIAVGAAAILALGACAGDDDDEEAGETPEPRPKSRMPTSRRSAMRSQTPMPIRLNLPPPKKPHPTRSVPTSRQWPSKKAAPRSAAEDEPAARLRMTSSRLQPSVGDYMADNCGYQVIDVTATDDAFDGIPADAEAGKTLIRITNDGTEYHEVALQRVHDGETRSVEEILALPEEEGGDLLDYLGNAFAPPGTGQLDRRRPLSGSPRGDVLHPDRCHHARGVAERSVRRHCAAARDARPGGGDTGHISTTPLEGRWRDQSARASQSRHSIGLDSISARKRDGRRRYGSVALRIGGPDVTTFVSMQRDDAPGTQVPGRYVPNAQTKPSGSRAEKSREP